MRKIKAQPITVENFHPYGDFTDILNPSGYEFGGFYRDQVLMNVSGGMQIAFSPLIVKKPEKMVVTTAEYHNTTQEGILCLDDDIIVHVAPAGKEPVPQLTEAFLVPKGTLVRLHTGTWHYSAIPVNKEEAHVLIVLPERIYFNDCYIVDYPEEDCVEIEL